MAMGAVDNARASRRQLAAPVLKFVGISPDSADDHPIVGSEGRAAADIDENGCGGRADRGIQILRGNRRGLISVHARALLAMRVAQSLDGKPSDGVSALPRCVY